MVITLKLYKVPPDVIGDYIDCQNCTSLQSLDGLPKNIKEYLNCQNCQQIKTLDGSPDDIPRIYCRNCDPDFIKLVIEKYGKEKVRS